MGNTEKLKSYKKLYLGRRRTSKVPRPTAPCGAGAEAKDAAVAMRVAEAQAVAVAETYAEAGAGGEAEAGARDEAVACPFAGPAQRFGVPGKGTSAAQRSASAA